MSLPTLRCRVYRDVGLWSAVSGAPAGWFLLDIDRPVNYSFGMDIVHDTKQRLLDAAFALFYARSYADVGVQEICEKAGVKKGSFYHSLTHLNPTLTHLNPHSNPLSRDGGFSLCPIAS